MTLDVTLIPILKDNYAYILKSDNKIAILDPGAAQPIIQYFDENNITPHYIFNTHHHWDHTDGNDELAKKYNLKIVAPLSEQQKIGHIDIGLKDKSIFEFGDTSFQAIETKGHTQGHLCLWFENEKILFSGDMIFALGCGRPMEGDAEDLFKSFQKISFLPDETIIYCGHEYTQTNAEFSLSINPNDDAILNRMADIKEKRAKNIPTIPTTMQLERKTNLFMRAKDLKEFQSLRDARNKF